MLSYAFFILLALTPQVFGQNSWNYAGEEYWNISTVEQCHGVRQSPININTSEVFDLYFYNQLGLKDYNMDVAGKLKNNGHTIVWTPTTAMGELTMPLLSGTYKFHSFHFHWGSHEQQGSEHTINGRALPMELHLVHFNKKYTDLAEAVTKEDGIAVIAILFQVSYETLFADDVASNSMKAIIDGFKNDQIMRKTTAPNGVDVTVNLMHFLSNVGRTYYHYKGSLTTPPCNEVVNFIILECALPIKATDLQEFRDHLEYNDQAPMVDNFRNVQWHNNRFIQRIFN